MTVARFVLINSILMLLMLGNPKAAIIDVAVARTFPMPAQEIAASFEQKNRHETILSFGASGQFSRQITRTVPVPVFFPGRRLRPGELGEKGLDPPEACLIYATGKSVLSSSSAKFVNGADTLDLPSFAKLSTYIPAAPPCGAAAALVTEAPGICEAMWQKPIGGTTITQAHQFAKTRNAEPGLVALSQLTDGEAGLRYPLPQEVFDPLQQHAVRLEAGPDKKDERAFVDVVKGPKAPANIARRGNMREDWS